MTIFTAAAGLSNPHLQTLVPRFIRKQALFAPQWQTLETPDGDFLDLAWSESPESDTPSNEARSNKPIFVLFHGLEGSFESLMPTG